MNTSFRDTGKISVLASASDKKFLRTNITDGLKESLKLNQTNAPLLGLTDVKIFEIGTVWNPTEEMHVAYGNKKEIKETKLDEFLKISPGAFEKEWLSIARDRATEQKHLGEIFNTWSLFPFITRDIALWAKDDTTPEEVIKIIKENMGTLVVRGPELFDQFKKDGRISYAFRLVFQSFERTLTDEEINVFMQKITNALTEKGFEIR